MSTHGPGEPELAIVGGIHGDEPSGVRAVERLRAAAERDELDLRRGVKLVVANPPAVEAGVRFLDSDLNRIFPGDPDGDREHRLAAALVEETRGMRALALHSTHSCPDPIAMFDSAQSGMLEAAAALPVPYVVDHRRGASGTYADCAEVVTIEAGTQWTEAAAVTAERLAVEFLRIEDALPGLPDSTDSAYFRMETPVPKPPSKEYEFLAENFRLVERGEAFARADDRILRADDPFYPVLMSAWGYADVFGYRGQKIGDSVAEAHEWLYGFRGNDT